MNGNIFLELSVLLAVTATVAFVLRFLRQPLVVAYLIAGVLVGPFMFNVLRGDAALYRAFADVGIVLLLFVVGLNLNLRHLKTIARSSVVAGVGQFLFTAVVGFLLLLALPLSMAARAYLAVAVTFSSTIVIVKLLTDKHHAERLYGRHVIGLMIVQDLIALLLLIALNTVGSTLTDAFVGATMARAIAVIVGTALLARYVLPSVLRYAACSPEHLFLTSIAWCFGVAALVYGAGFSLELGALAAGISLATSPYQPEIISRIRPLRDFFLVLFFLVLGATLRFSDINRAFVAGAALSAFILIGNPIILYAIYRRLGFTRRNSFLAGVTAAQVSEFGFVLILIGQRLEHVGGDTLAAFTLTALVTIIASTYLITYSETLFRFFRPFLARFGRDDQQREPPVEKYDAWVFGYHRIGWKVAETLRKYNTSFAAADDNPAAIAELRNRGIPSYFGDASDDEFLEMLPIAESRLIISTIPDPETSLVLLRHLRQHLKSKSCIILTADHARDLNDLYAAGADFVTLPHLLSGMWIADLIGDRRALTPATFKHLRKEQTEELKLRSARVAP